MRYLSLTERVEAASVMFGGGNLPNNLLIARLRAGCKSLSGGRVSLGENPRMLDSFGGFAIVLVRVVNQPSELVDILPGTYTADDRLQWRETGNGPVESPMPGNNWRPREGNLIQRAAGSTAARP